MIALTTATVSFLFTNFMLCVEEYRSEWRYPLFFMSRFVSPFVIQVGGGSAFKFWVLGYGLFYWASRVGFTVERCAVPRIFFSCCRFRFIDHRYTSPSGSNFKFAAYKNDWILGILLGCTETNIAQFVLIT